MDKYDDNAVTLPGDDYIPGPRLLVVGLIVFAIILAAGYAVVFF